MRKYETIAALTAVFLVAASFAGGLISGFRSRDGLSLRAAIIPGPSRDLLLTGYNYFLLEEFAADSKCRCEIVISGKGDSYLDSLPDGTVDIVALPYVTRTFPDSLGTPVVIDSCSIWLVSPERKRTAGKAEEWIKNCSESGRLDTLLTRFRAYDPRFKARKGGRSAFLSPYDDIIRQYADSLGWDWKLLAAVIYQESQFKIEARSHRGAIGLMQIMPATVRARCDGDPLNPENNIRSGTRHLEELSRLYRRVSPYEAERMKFTLAAYNAGAGRIRDVINYSRLRGVGTASWDSVSTVIPEMRDSLKISGTDTVKLGTFNGSETISYVNSVMSLYDAMNAIYSGQ